MNCPYCNKVCDFFDEKSSHITCYCKKCFGTPYFFSINSFNISTSVAFELFIDNKPYVIYYHPANNKVTIYYNMEFTDVRTWDGTSPFVLTPKNCKQYVMRFINLKAFL
jgi:hypothetical protein